MTPEERERSCIIVPLENGDLALFTRNGDPVLIADIRPVSFGGQGLGGLLNAIEIAVNRTRTDWFRIPVKGASQPGEYWTRHSRTPGQGKSPVPVVTVPARTVTSAASLGLFKKPKE